MDLLARTGVGRDINRHHYTPEEVVQDLRKPVVSALLDLLRLRRSCPAFGGTCAVTGQGPKVGLSWTAGAHSASLEADLATSSARITVSGPGFGTRTCEDLLTGVSAILPR